jgi:hypothetical protein
LPTAAATITFARRQRVRTLYQHSETATIVGKEPAHVLDGRWYIVAWDDGGGACIHEDMLAASNDPPFKGRLPLIHKVTGRPKAEYAGVVQ